MFQTRSLHTLPNKWTIFVCCFSCKRNLKTEMCFIPHDSFRTALKGGDMPFFTLSLPFWQKCRQNDRSTSSPIGPRGFLIIPSTNHPYSRNKIEKSGSLTPGEPHQPGLSSFDLLNLRDIKYLPNLS